MHTEFEQLGYHWVLNRTTAIVMYIRKRKVIDMQSDVTVPELSQESTPVYDA